MNQEIKRQILDKIKSYDRIVISRHVRPDGDAVGSSKGLQSLIKSTYPDKEVLLINGDYSKYLEFLGGEDEQIADELYHDALCIVVDTATADRVSNKKFSLAKEVIKIDHHIVDEHYGDVVWVEEERSSLCELIADFYLTFKDELVLTKEGATYIYTGMVTDSGRFRHAEVNGETLRNAGAMLDKGVDTEWLFANLNLESFDYHKFGAYVYKKMKITPNGVAYIVVDDKMRKRFNLSLEQASNVVGKLDSIKGCIIWVAFIQSEKNTYRVRLRSRFVAVNRIAEDFNGGGHAFACGATLHGKDQIKRLLAMADELQANYMAEHPEVF